MNKFLNVPQLAEKLVVSTKTVYGWILLKKVPYYKVGRLVRFDENEINDWLKNGKVEPYQ